MFLKLIKYKGDYEKRIILNHNYPHVSNSLCTDLDWSSISNWNPYEDVIEVFGIILISNIAKTIRIKVLSIEPKF